jgi:hypothetical protein
MKPAVAKVYIVTFLSHDDRGPSKFIVLADNMRAAINMAWEHGWADFQSRYRQIHRASPADERGSAARFMT